VKILVVHQYYLQPGEPGGSRFNEFCRIWSAAGHDVTVIAGTVNYATGQSPERFRGRWTTREQDGTVGVWRCHVPSSYGRGYAGRAWAFFAFTFSAATAALQAGGADVVIATSPPLIAAIPGWLAARRHGSKLVFEIRDLHPESAVTTGVLAKDALLTRALYALERWACRAADRINVLTPAFRDDLVSRGLAPEGKIVFVPNGADLELFTPGPHDNTVRRELGWGERTVFMYSGAHGRANALRQLVESAALLRERPDILIACVGDGPERRGLQEAAAGQRLTNIIFYGPQPKDRMPEFINACDVGVAVLQKNPTFRTVYPNKVFDYMSCERPTLLAIDGVARQLVCEDAQAGLYVEPENAEAIASGIGRLAQDPELRRDMGRRGRAWVEANASREVLARRYLGILQGLSQA
jgi:glycosyltransferase involved in cell wall biosynthesis